MRDYEKPILNKRGEPLKILQSAAHHCIRVIKKSRALQKIGYTVHGIGDMMAYGTDGHETYTTWKSEKQFKNAIKMYVDAGVDIIEWNNEPNEPAKWIRETLKEMNREDVKLVVDCHDLDAVRKHLIPLDERQLFNHADGIIYVSLPIQERVNVLQNNQKPNIVLYSYCNEGIVEYDEGDIPKRRGVVYEGGANPPEDYVLNQQFAYRSLYGIIKRMVEMGNETHMMCGNLTAFDTYHGTGAILYPPTHYDEMMKKLVMFKFGLLIFNNEDGKKDQVNLTLTNKEEEYLQAGLPSLACWCPESVKHVQKHGIGFVFNHIDEVKQVDTTISHKKYMDVMQNIKAKRKELVMENFIWKLENMYADLLETERKGIPEKVKAINVFEYGEEDVSKLLC